MAISTLRLDRANTGAQNSDAWDTLMASLAPGQGATVQLEAGVYVFARQIDVIRPVHVIGAPGGAHQPSTRLIFPAGSHGFYCHSYTTLTGESSFNRADGSRLERLWIQGDSKTSVKHGVVIKAPMTVEDCYVDGFCGDGVNIHANLPEASVSLALVRSNSLVNNGRSRAIASAVLDGVDLVVTTTAPHDLVTNDFVWLHRGQRETNPWAQQRGVTVTSSTAFRVSNWTTEHQGLAWAYFTPTTVKTGNGMFCQGADASAINFWGNSYVNNECWGAYDCAFLGNIHVGEHADTSNIGAFFSAQSTSPTVWIGCYSESSCPQSFIQRPNVVVGGDHGAPLYGSWVGIGHDCDNIQVAVRGANGIQTGNVRIGSPADANPTYMQFNVPGVPSPLLHAWDFASAQLGGWGATLAAYNYAYGAGAGYLVTGPASTVPNGRTPTAGRLAFPDGFYMSAGSRWDEGTAAPTAGARMRGDRRWNSLPAVGSPEYWVCTVSGTPGTWVAGPNL